MQTISMIFWGIGKCFSESENQWLGELEFILLLGLIVIKTNKTKNILKINHFYFLARKLLFSNK